MSGFNKGSESVQAERPLQLTQVEEVCEVQMTEPIRAIPSSCSQRIAELNHTLWQQLFEDEWLFVTPVVDVLTVLCVKHEPIDVTLIGTGRLKLQPMCKAYEIGCLSTPTPLSLTITLTRM